MLRGTKALLGTLVLVPAVMAFGLAIALWHSFAVFKVWQWYIPYGEPSLSIAFGLALITNIFCKGFVYEENKAASVGGVIYAVLLPGFVLLFAAVGKLFL